MKKIFIALILWGLIATVSAYTNGTMTGGYRRVVYGDPIGGVMYKLGLYFPDGWIHALGISLLYLMIWISHESIVIPNAVLMIFIIIWGIYLPAMLFEIIFILVVFALAMTLMKVYSPLWSK